MNFNIFLIFRIKAIGIHLTMKELYILIICVCKRENSFKNIEK